MLNLKSTTLPKDMRQQRQVLGPKNVIRKASATLSSYPFNEIAEVNELSLQQLFDKSAIGMAIFNQAGAFMVANRAYCDMSGYFEKDLLTMNFDGLFGPLKQKKTSGRLQAILDSDLMHQQIKLRLVRKDGSSVSAGVTLTSLKLSKALSPLFLIVIENFAELNNIQTNLENKQSNSRELISQIIGFHEHERKRLSRELHDDIGQRISLATSEIAMLASQYSLSVPLLGDRLASLRDDLDRLCSDLHYMSHDLHSSKLQHLGLRSALKELCSKFLQSGLKVELNTNNAADPQSEDVSLCLYRVAQEALNNCAKHARALSVTVTLTKLRDTFYMTVQDTGIGFDTHANWEGLGLLSMKERLKLVNGRLDVRSILGRGTEILVSIPEKRGASTAIDRPELVSVFKPGPTNASNEIAYFTNKKIRGASTARNLG